MGEEPPLTGIINFHGNGRAPAEKRIAHEVIEVFPTTIFPG
jgi:hypothetical protein